MNRDELLSMRLHHQYLARPCQDHLLLAEAACGLQAQYYNNVYYSMIIRCGNKKIDGWDKNLLKTWTLRGTLHAVPPKDLSLYVSFLHGNAYITKRDLQLDYLNQLADEVMSYIQAGVGSRQELKKIFQRRIKDSQIIDLVFSSWGGIFTLLASQGRIVFNSVSGRDFCAVKSDVQTYSREMALDDLLRRYYKFYGPATVADAAKFLGVAQSLIKQRLKNITGLKHYFLNSKEYYCLYDLITDYEIPQICFLTGFDPLIIGYKDVDLILEEIYLRRIITLTGIIKPAVMVNGKIYGHWSIKKKALYIELFKPLDAKAKRRLNEYALNIFEDIVIDIVMQ